MQRSPLLADAEWLRSQYEAGRSCKELAEEIGCGAMTIWNRLRRYGVETRKAGSQPVVAPGERYARLLVVEEVASHERHRAYLCRCDCGAEVTVRGSRLRSGGVRSCGCLRTTHGHTDGNAGSPEYRAWGGMRQRCMNPNNTDWRLYGARGITVAPEWLGRGGFQRFLAHIGPCPEGMTLDRINTNGNYEPGNVRWATLSQQNSNRRPFARKAA